MALETELRKIIDAEIDRLKIILADGVAVTEFADYRHIVGQIFAYNRVLADYLDEAATEANKR